ncbi:MAG: lecithin retinol acyltransferase family protein [Candidatus Delongbacteria bacterium]|nr:lecithin retinol acyltransferase family protein [Candidatus Delongbacteria bacterium]MBN2835739.1 lecithin retinol acyltransferase family protein [Candidatus Delongbacteria bacterium]
MSIFENLFGFIKDAIDNSVIDAIKPTTFPKPVTLPRRTSDDYDNLWGTGRILDKFKRNFLMDHITPERGTIVFCELFGVEHSGVYVGNGNIVELTGKGEVRLTDETGFLEETNGFSIYAACNDSRSLRSDQIAERALEMVGHWTDYNLILNNCHQFTAGCIIDDFDNPNNFFWMLMEVISKKMNKGKMITRRVCDF